MNRFWNSRTGGLSPYVPGEQPREPGLIKLNTNENPYPPSPRVLEAIRNAAGADLRRYPDPECRELREAAARAYGVGPEQVFPGNGSDEALAFTFGAFFETQGPPIRFPEITYSFYPVYAGLWGIPCLTVPLGEDFAINIEDFLVPSGGVVFPNPNAPTGMALSPDRILPLAEYLARQNRVLVVDEAYGAFAGDLSLVPHIHAHPNLLTLHTLSKMGSLAGLRVGFAIGDEALIEGLRRVRDSFNSYPVDRLAQAGAAAALADGGYYRELTGRIIATRERVSRALGELGFEVLPSAANFICLRKPGVAGAELMALLRERGILVRRFNQRRIEDFLRVTIGTDEEMDSLLRALEGILGEKLKTPGLRDQPQGLRDQPPGLRDQPQGLRDQPQGLRDKPPGIPGNRGEG